MGLRLGIQLSVACHAWNSEFKPHCHHIQRLELKIWVLGTVVHACQSITLQTKVGGDQPRLWGVPKQLSPCLSGTTWKTWVASNLEEKGVEAPHLDFMLELRQQLRQENACCTSVWIWIQIPSTHVGAMPVCAHRWPRAGWAWEGRDLWSVSEFRVRRELISYLQYHVWAMNIISHRTEGRKEKEEPPELSGWSD